MTDFGEILLRPFFIFKDKRGSCGVVVYTYGGKEHKSLHAARDRDSEKEKSVARWLYRWNRDNRSEMNNEHKRTVTGQSSKKRVENKYTRQLYRWGI